MRALVRSRYGAPTDVLSVEEVDTPHPGDGDVLIRVNASSINPADWHIVRGDPRVARLEMGLRAPKRPIPGYDVVGEVVEVGAGVDRLSVGQRVIAYADAQYLGAFAEFVSLPHEVVVPIDTSVAEHDAAALPLAGCTALDAVRDRSGVGAGGRLLVVGGSGGIGHLAVQIAKDLDIEVTATCSAHNVEMVESLGADHVVDHSSIPVEHWGSGFDAAIQLGGTASFGQLRRLVRRGGAVMPINGDGGGSLFGPIPRLFSGVFTAPFVPQRWVTFTNRPTVEQLTTIATMASDGRLRSVVSNVVSLADAPAAIESSEAGHATGKTVVSIDD